MAYLTKAMRIEVDQSKLPGEDGAGIDAIKVAGNPTIQVWHPFFLPLNFTITYIRSEGGILTLSF